MNKDQKHIDDLFREKLSGFELPTSDKDFEAIQLGLKKPKKKGFFLWFIIPALLLSIGASRYLMDTLTEPVAESISTEPNKVTDNAAVDEVPVVTMENSLQPGEVPAQPDPDQERIEDDAAELKYNSLDGSVNWTAGTDSEAPKGIVPSSNRMQTEVEPKDRFILSVIPRKLKVGFANWPLQGMEIPSQLLVHDPIWDRIKPLPNENEPHFTPSAELIVGTNLGKQLIPPGESSNPNFREFKQNERAAPALQLGMLGNLSKLRSEFSSGLIYNEYRFYNDNFTTLIYDSIPFRNTNGDTIAWIRRNYRDSVYMERQQLNFRAISIPIQYAYNYKIGPKWALGASIGMRTSFFLPTKGTSIDSRGSLRTNSEIKIDAVQLNYMLGMQLRYAIDPAISVGLRMQYSGALDGTGTSGPDGAIRLNDLNFQMNLRYEWYHR